MLLLTPSVSGLFKWRQFEPEVILLAVGWYLRFSLSYRDAQITSPRQISNPPCQKITTGQHSAWSEVNLLPSNGSNELALDAVRPNAWRCVYRLVRGGRIFLRDFPATI